METPLYIKNINKKYLAAITVVVLFLVILGGYAFYKNISKDKLSLNESLELEIRQTIENNIENWPLYEKIADKQYKKFGNDQVCSASIKGNPDFMSYLQQAENGETYKLDLTHGAYLVYTPNYNNWNNEKLFSFGVGDMRICSAGWLIPLYAYSDKIVWGNITCSDGVLSQEFESCLKITQIIMGYFTTKQLQ